MRITDMYQSPEVGVYVPRPYVKRQFPLVRYGTKTIFELMDIFLPDAGEGPFPAVIDIHGGGYFYGSRASVRMEPVLELIHRGYVVVTLDYTLSPYGKFPLQVQEIKAAVRYLRAHADKYHIDPERIGLWGLSAGAHLAVLAAVSAGVKELDDPAMGNGEYPDTVQAVVDLYGPVDLAIGDGDDEEDPSGTMSATFFGRPLSQAPTESAAPATATGVSKSGTHFPARGLWRSTVRRSRQSGGMYSLSTAGTSMRSGSAWMRPTRCS